MESLKELHSEVKYRINTLYEKESFKGITAFKTSSFKDVQYKFSYELEKVVKSFKIFFVLSGLTAIIILGLRFAKVTYEQALFSLDNGLWSLILLFILIAITVKLYIKMERLDQLFFLLKMRSVVEEHVKN